MAKWQKTLSIILIALGVAGFKWNGVVAARIRSIPVGTSSNEQIAASAYDNVKQVTSSVDSIEISVALFSIAMLSAGIVWLNKRASTRATENRFILDFSKKTNHLKG